MPDTRTRGGGLPATQHAIQFVAPGRLVHNRAKPVPRPGPTQLVLQVEAVGICFSDTKLLHAFTAHLRKAEVTGGIDKAALAEIPSYVPGERPTVPGHEVAGRIVATGPGVTRHAVGERVLVQTDYRHLPTPGSNAAFGYNFEGGLQEYVLLDERMIIEPGTDERFLIPVERGAQRVGGRPARAVGMRRGVVRVARAAGARPAGPAARRRGPRPPGRGPRATARRAAAQRARATGRRGAPRRGSARRHRRRAPDAAGRAALEAAAGQAGAPVTLADGLDGLPAESFDDIVYFGADADRIEALQGLLASRGVIDVVLGGEAIGRPVAIDVGRIHYDLTRWVGTPGRSAADGYARVPADGELRAGDRVAVIGAAGPMGFMHVIRTAASGLPGVTLVAIDIDDARLAHLERIAGPLAAARGVGATFLNSRTSQPAAGLLVRGRHGAGAAACRPGGRPGRGRGARSTSSPGSRPGPGPPSTST